MSAPSTPNNDEPSLLPKLSMAEALNVAKWLKEATKERRAATIAGLATEPRTLQVIELCRLVQQLTGTGFL